MGIAVIGTGLAGLACAQALAEAGEAVTLFDKSRGYGGRVASRRREGLAFDHGLPAFDPVSAETVPALADLPEWEAHGRVAAPRMNAFPRTMGEAFESRMGTRIVSVDAETLALTDEAGEAHGGFERIVAAIPAPQAWGLLASHDDAFAPIAEATYAPCWTLMVGGVAGETAVPHRFAQETGVIALLLRDDAKPGHTAPAPCYVAHATREWSRENLERDAADVAEDLCIAFAAMTGLDPDGATYRAAHRWRYCAVERAVEAPFLLSADGRIGACGDWAGADRSGGDARAAWRSGAALGRAMAR